ncbi:uncharacterized protein LOC121429122 [Lytechinus variegatus]|uniref:uncharacterized protein LOC121429122 n=1 Tax=Lytechinus variegatus TaxID=7654 RepID=UPI001BB21C62|nr:uncharacterized protein LOC121429122 [Lytechinus variegatus]XP_041481968.1 uncharacterized protein LOC121429122 [Lytechinus variegatus]XP_041481970.1 uncharacterized protein LOC121429122 [Lytechinus variegatus]
MAAHQADPPTSTPASDPYTPKDPKNDYLLLEMRKMFTDFQRDIDIKLDHVISDLNAVKSDIRMVKSAVHDLEISSADTSARISTVEADKLPGIERFIAKVRADFDDKLLNLEIHHRKQNLLFYGIPKQTNEDIYKTTSFALGKLLEIPVEEADQIQIINAHRLPTKRTHNGASGTPAPEAPDPIIVRFAKMYDRDRILRAFEQPRQPRATDGNRRDGDRVTVRTDLPPSMKRERGHLASVAYNIRRTKQLKTRIRIQGTKVLLQTKNPNAPSSQWSTWTE